MKYTFKCTMKDCDMDMSVDADSKEEAIDKLVMHAKTHLENDHSDTKMTDDELRKMIAGDMQTHEESDESSHSHASV